MVMDLGKLTALHEEPSQEPSIPFEFHTFAAAAEGGEVKADDKTVADKAVADAKDVPSVWFVNFPTSEAFKKKDTLQTYMQNVQDYRCWASLVWWRTVYGRADVPQDGSQASIAFRNAYCARVATKHMQTTPWLAMSSNNNASKEVNCNVTEFHTELVKAVLEGFVIPTPAIFVQLEKILDSLRKTINTSSGSKDNRTIVCERYEYLDVSDTIKSYVRIISFAVTDSIKTVQNAKKTEKQVSCTIEYNDYEAVFNQKLWDSAAEDISAEQKKATKKFVGDQTIDCPP